MADFIKKNLQNILQNENLQRKKLKLFQESLIIFFSTNAKVNYEIIKDNNIFKSFINHSIRWKKIKKKHINFP